MGKKLSFRESLVCPIIETKNIKKVYPNGTEALSGVNLAIMKDDFTIMIGSSGAGKSTYLRCLNRLVKPTSGSIKLLDEDVTHVNGQQLNYLRRRMGMIFQQFNLVHRLPVLENVLVGRLRFSNSPVRFSMSILRRFSKAEKEKAFECLKMVGIEQLAFQRADTLSGGQQQRVAIARALAQEPDVFLADEPIASLDPRSASTVMEILKKIQEEKKIPVLINLHHIEFTKRYAKRIIGMKNGKIVFDGQRSELTEGVIEKIYGKAVKEGSREELYAPA